jgi:hypothetical protein
MQSSTQTYSPSERILQTRRLNHRPASCALCKLSLLSLRTCRKFVLATPCQSSGCLTSDDRPVLRVGYAATELCTSLPSTLVASISISLPISLSILTRLYFLHYHSATRDKSPDIDASPYYQPAETPCTEQNCLALLPAFGTLATW